MIKVVDIGSIRILEFDSEKKTNPFSIGMMKDLRLKLQASNVTSTVQAIILTGGNGKSFCVGGDFKEVMLMKDGTDVQLWINEIIDTYIAILNVEKPCIAAIDYFAIGIGFQLSLMCDFRIGTVNTQFVLPELKGGISCTIGGFLLERCFGRVFMQKIVYSCKPIHAEEAVSCNLLNQLAPTDLIGDAIMVANEYAAYPQLSFGMTKRIVNSSLANDLNSLRNDFIISHVIPIERMSGQKYYQSILKLPRHS